MDEPTDEYGNLISLRDDVDPNAVAAVNALRVGAYASAVGYLLRVIDRKIEESSPRRRASDHTPS